MPRTGGLGAVIDKLRDPIHGFVELDDIHVRLIDHPAFQRLRRIHQLAMAYLVFPGANHTRFEHSVGTMSIAAQLGKAVKLDARELHYLKIAALCHDLGHGPFSHVSEQAIEACSDSSGETEKLHERITGLLIRGIIQRDGLLSQMDADNVCQLLDSTQPVRTVSRDIVSGPLDADKLDYLLRDSYYAGVRYGVYDLPRLLSGVIRIGDRVTPGSYLGIQADDIPSVDQFVLARANMRQVYYHRVRRIADAMLVRSVVLAHEEGIGAVSEVFAVSKVDEDYLERYLQMDEDVLVRTIVEGSDGPSGSLMRRLTQRQLVKEIFHAPLSQCNDPGMKIRLLSMERAEREVLEKQIAERCSVPDWLVFVDVQGVSSLRKGAGEEGPEKIPVLDGRVVRSYDELSPIFRHRPVYDESVHVFAPISSTKGLIQEAEERRSCETAARETLGFGEPAVPTTHLTQPS